MHPSVFSEEYLCPPYSPFPTLARLWEGFVEGTRSRVVLVVLVVQVVLLNCVELVVRVCKGGDLYCSVHESLMCVHHELQLL